MTSIEVNDVSWMTPGTWLYIDGYYYKVIKQNIKESTVEVELDE